MTLGTRLRNCSLSSYVKFVANQKSVNCELNQSMVSLPSKGLLPVASRIESIMTIGKQNFKTGVLLVSHSPIYPARKLRNNQIKALLPRTIFPDLSHACFVCSLVRNCFTVNIYCKLDIF